MFKVFTDWFKERGADLSRLSFYHSSGSKSTLTLTLYVAEPGHNQIRQLCKREMKMKVVGSEGNRFVSGRYEIDKDHILEANIFGGISCKIVDTVTEETVMTEREVLETAKQIEALQEMLISGAKKKTKNIWSCDQK